MAEWLCRGLQILVQRFDSASGLQFFDRPQGTVPSAALFSPLPRPTLAPLGRRFRDIDLHAGCPDFFDELVDLIHRDQGEAAAPDADETVNKLRLFHFPHRLARLLSRQSCGRNPEPGCEALHTPGQKMPRFGARRHGMAVYDADRRASVMVSSDKRRVSGTR